MPLRWNSRPLAVAAVAETETQNPPALQGTLVQLGHSASALGQGAAEVRGVLDDTHKAVQAQQQALQLLASELAAVREAQQRISAGTQASHQATEAAGEALQELAGEVQGIAASLQQVSEAAQEITQVALNTRLVAFNATVEAKRAGEAGRGFAVVADAVKDLAARVEATSKQIVGSVQQLTGRIEKLRADLQRSEPAKGIHGAMDAIREDVQLIEQAAAQSAAQTLKLDQQSREVQTQLGGTLGGLQRAVGHADGFLTLSEQLIETIAESGVATLDTPFIEAAQQAAGEIAGLLEEALRRGDIDSSALFDETYRPQAGSDPQQFMTAFCALAERLFSPVQERLLGLSDKVVFCIAVDRNGYVPMHNKKVSQAQRAGDPLWNAANSRWRRIFNDRTGLASARNGKPFLLQTYRRDMGGGNFVVLKECAAPITVRGRHWGGLRLAYRF